jgi:hypothetical protein
MNGKLSLVPHRLSRSVIFRPPTSVSKTPLTATADSRESKLGDPLGIKIVSCPPPGWRSSLNVQAQQTRATDYHFGSHPNASDRSQGCLISLFAHHPDPCPREHYCVPRETSNALGVGINQMMSIPVPILSFSRRSRGLCIVV